MLGATKKKGMGAKKVVVSSSSGGGGVGGGGGADLDFEEAERRAREEAERIQKLGYDPDAEEEQQQKVQSEAQIKAAQPSEPGTIVSPTPISPARAGVPGAAGAKGSADMERLGMGVTRLGFGQVGGGSKAAGGATAAPKMKMGFGSVGATRGAATGML